MQKVYLKNIRIRIQNQQTERQTLERVSFARSISISFYYISFNLTINLDGLWQKECQRNL